MKTHFIAALALAFLSESAIMAMLDTDSRDNVQKENYKFVESPFYIRADITAAGGEIELIKTSTTEKHGTINFDKGKLPELENLVLYGLTIGHAYVAATGDDPAQVKYSTVDSNTVPAALANASIVITQDNKEIVNLPIDLFFQGTASEAVRANVGYAFENFRLIKANRSFKVNIKFPDGVSMPAEGGGGERHYLQVNLNGAVTKLK